MNTPLIIAHRGASGYFEENTLESIIHAIKLNSDIIEIDLRLTKDNVIVLSHDDEYVLNSCVFKISETNYDVLETEIVNFEKLLSEIDIGVIFYLDIKCFQENIEIFTDKLLDILYRYQERQFYIASFSEKFIIYFSKLSYNCNLGMIYEKLNIKQYESIENIINFVVLDIQTVTIDDISILKPKKTFLYTVNKLDNIAPYLKIIDGIVTDYPDIFKDQ